MNLARNQAHLNVKPALASFRIAFTMVVLLSGMAASAGAQPPPPPGCGVFFCGTMTLIKDPSIGIPFADPENALGPPWVSYELGLHTPFLGSGQSLAIQVMIDGQLHQSWSDVNRDGVFEPSPLDADTSAGDSHLLAPAGSPFGLLPFEDNTGNGSPLPDTPATNYGVGTRLRGAWANLNASKYTKVAYIVIPKGSPLEVTVNWALPADPQGTLTTRDLIWIPEPSTAFLAILAFSGYLLAISRRRRPDSTLT